MINSSLDLDEMTFHELYEIKIHKLYQPKSAGWFPSASTILRITWGPPYVVQIMAFNNGYEEQHDLRTAVFFKTYEP